MVADPQRSAISPVLAKLFMHYAFGTWLAREFPLVRFERYADDAVRPGARALMLPPQTDG
jgi:retron-type reverse transcriptase